MTRTGIYTRRHLPTKPRTVLILRQYKETTELSVVGKLYITHLLSSILALPSPSSKEVPISPTNLQLLLTRSPTNPPSNQPQTPTMGKHSDDDHRAGGGSAHSTPADLSSPILQQAIKQHNGDTILLSSPAESLIALPTPEQKDWSQPLSSYFISSSHNTYLTGHQLYGESTTAGYKNVLLRGCRCIEIDVWDGGDGEPEVFHGYTLTKEIKFEDVCKAIKKYAFTREDSEEREEMAKYEGAGEGPVIISLECHAKEEQQRKMVEIMERVWGEMLVKDVEPEEVGELPSPEALRRRIVVKAKYTPPEQDPAGMVAAAITQPAKRSNSSWSRRSSSDSSSDSELEELSRLAKKQKPKKAKMIRPLSRLGAYCSSHHFPSRDPGRPFVEHKTSLLANHVYSFSEKVFANHHEKWREDIFTHNKGYLMRVYPFGLRFSSSNGDPVEFWKRGVQLVALNWQKCDEGMMLNEGLFAGEGGYVLKPEGFRPGDAPPQYKQLDLTIEIIAAANIPLPDKNDKAKSFEPYVKVEIHVPGDVPNSKEKLKGKTKAKRGVECAWNEKLEFKGVQGVLEKITFVRFKVHDEEFGVDDLAAWACVRLDRMREGLRVVRLFDNEGRHSKGVLLVKVSKRVY
jgi:hypothetical protein